MNDPCHQTDAEIDKALGQDWPDKVTPKEAVAIARLPMRGLNEREIIIRITLLLDAANRQFAELQRLGAITSEFSARSSGALTTITRDLANIPAKR